MPANRLHGKLQQEIRKPSDQLIWRDNESDYEHRKWR